MFTFSPQKLHIMPVTGTTQVGKLLLLVMKCFREYNIIAHGFTLLLLDFSNVDYED